MRVSGQASLQDALSPSKRIVGGSFRACLHAVEKIIFTSAVHATLIPGRQEFDMYTKLCIPPI